MEGEDGGKDSGKEKAEWEVERQRHADTQRELLSKLKEIRDEWEGEKAQLSSQLQAAQEALMARQEQLDDAVAQQGQHSQHSSALHQQIAQLEQERTSLLDQVTGLTSSLASVTSDLAQCHATLLAVEAKAAQAESNLALRSKELQEERSWRGELERSLTRLQSESAALESSNADTVRSMRLMEERVQELHDGRLRLEAELQASAELIAGLEAELTEARTQTIALQEEVLQRVEAVKRESAAALTALQAQLQRQGEEQRRLCGEWEAQVSTLQQRNAQLTSDLRDAEQGRQAQSTVVASLRADGAAKAEEVGRLTAEVATLREQQVAVRHELVTLYTHHTSVTQEVAEKATELQGLQSQVEEARAALHAKDAALHEAHQRHEQLTGVFAALQHEADARALTLTVQATNLHHAVDEVNRLTEARADADARLSEALEERTGLEREIAALEAQLERLASKSHTASDALRAANDRIHALEGQQAHWQVTAHSLEADLQQATSRLAACEADLGSRESTIATLTAECEELRAVKERMEAGGRQQAAEVAQMRQRAQEEGEWRAKYDESRELCLLLKAESDRAHAAHAQQLQEARREEQRLTAAVERLERAAVKDKERQLQALKEADERRAREVAAEKRKAAAELSHVLSEKAELNRSLSKEVADFKRAATAANNGLVTAEGRLAQMTAAEVKLVQERMKAERRVKELTQTLQEKERELATATATVTSAVTRTQVAPLQAVNARLTAELTAARVEVEALKASDALQRVAEMQGRHDGLIAQLDALTTQYEQCRALLQSSTHRQHELDALMEGAEHSNPHQRIHLHALIKEENRLVKTENEHIRRELVRHKRELKRLGVTLEDEAEQGEDGKAAGVEGGVGGVAAGAKENVHEGKKARRVGPRHRSALSSMN